MISKDLDDAIYIGDNPSLFYNSEQYEYLMNTSTLAKVAKVKISEANTSILTAVMVPKAIYDDNYKNKSNQK